MKKVGVAYDTLYAGRISKKGLALFKQLLDVAVVHKVIQEAQTRRLR